MTKNEIYQKLHNIQLETKQKVGLSYASWADVWKILKENFPDFDYKIYTSKHKYNVTKNIYDGDKIAVTETTTYEEELPYFTDGITCWVIVSIKIGDYEQLEYLPVMDNRNQAVRANAVTSTAVNKTLQRAFVKAAARLGLGLYIYRGQDLPIDASEIDYKGIEKRADALDAAELQKKISANLEGYKNEIKKMVLDLQTYAKDPIIAYVQKTLPCQISKANADQAAELGRIHYFLQEIQKIINE